MVSDIASRRSIVVMSVMLALAPAPVLPSAETAKLDERIAQARRLSMTDPTTDGLEILREQLAESDAATAEERIEMELLWVRSQSLEGRYDEALARARDLVDRSQNVDQRISALRLSAKLALDTGRFERAFAELSQAMTLLEGTDSPASRVSILGLASYFHSQSGDAWLALEYAQQALEFARPTDDARLNCEALGWLAQAHAGQDNLQQANELGRSALRLCEQIDDAVSIAWINNLLARVDLKAGRLDEAQRRVDQASELNRDRFRDSSNDSDLIRARLALRRGRYQDALDRYTELIDRLASDYQRQRHAEALDGAAEAAIRLGNLAEAVAFQKAHVEVQRQHLERTRSLRMAQLAMQFDRDRQQREIEFLKEQQRYRALTEESRRQRQLLRSVGLVGGVLLAALLMTWLVRTLRDRRHFRRLSDRDGLTGLFNHTRFFRQLERELAQTKHRTLVLIMADIDHFKRVNDRFGHQIGDEVLRHTARVLKEVFGKDQLIGRVGGEEFAVRLLDCSQEQASDLIQKLRDRLAGRARRPTDPPITLSFGFAEAQAGESLESLRRRTDAALYRAKERGRNRAMLADPLEH